MWTVDNPVEKPVGHFGDRGYPRFRVGCQLQVQTLIHREGSAKTKGYEIFSEIYSPITTTSFLINKR